MSLNLVISPLPVAALTGSSGDGAAWLLTASPREIFLAGAGTVQIVADMGAAVAIDSLFLGFTNASTAATWAIATAAAAGGPWADVMAATVFRMALHTGLSGPQSFTLQVYASQGSGLGDPHLYEDGDCIALELMK